MLFCGLAIRSAFMTLLRSRSNGHLELHFVHQELKMHMLFLHFKIALLRPGSDAVLHMSRIEFEFKAMLNEAIFLATCNATMTNKKPFKLQRACYTQATFLAM